MRLELEHFWKSPGMGMVLGMLIGTSISIFQIITSLTLSSPFLSIIINIFLNLLLFGFSGFLVGLIVWIRRWNMETVFFLFLLFTVVICYINTDQKQIKYNKFENSISQNLFQFSHR